MGSTTTSTRYAGKASKIQDPHDYHGRFWAEIDTRADTICAGQGFKLISYTYQVADVGGCHSDLGSLCGIPIATVATAYDTDNDGTIILVFHEALYFGQAMETSPISPQQVCDNGIQCDPLSKQYSPHLIHGIYDEASNTTIPFSLHGCISYFPIRLPTEQELSSCCRIELTSAHEEWRPCDTRFQQQEWPFCISATVTSQPSYNMLNNAYEPPAKTRFLCHTSSLDRRSLIDPVNLACRWGTSLEVADKTLQSSTQCCF